MARDARFGDPAIAAHGGLVADRGVGDGYDRMGEEVVEDRVSV
ncbi:hypothetical protein [Streptomyces sp. NPDC001970]